MQDHIGRMIQYRYENDLLVDVIHMEQGVTHYEYDEHGYLTREIDQSGVAYLTNKYDKKGRVVLQTLANGDYYQAQYVEEERKTIVYTNIGDKTTVYEYGKEQQELQDDSSNQEFSLFDTRIYYQYDAMKRLLEESYYENEVEETIQYEYDFCGNQLSKKQWKKQEKIEPNFKEEKSWYNTKNQLLKRQTENETIFYTYDKQGNTIQEVGGKVDRTYSYNPFGQQIRSENTNGYFQENFYDGEYLRAGVKRNGSSSKFLYYRGELLSEITKKQGERKGNRLILGYGVVASEELGLQNHRQENNNHNFHKKADRRTIGFYHFDERNSTAFITGKNQEIQNSYTYDAFGNIRNQKETLHNRILYTGQQYDRESNQYYVRARYYNPTLGRFTQEDVYRGDGLNLYDYCKGNPVVWYDPSGYYKVDIHKGIFLEHIITPKLLGKPNSDDLKIAMLKIILNDDNFNKGDTKVGSHQAQHIIPKSKEKHPVIGISGYQVDHPENGIFDINELSTPQQKGTLYKFLKERNIDINDREVRKYISDNTHHGYDRKSGGYDHGAYTNYVEAKLNQIAEKYDIDINLPMKDWENKRLKMGEEQIRDMQKDILQLNEELRRFNQVGIDLYLTNSENKKRKKYQEGSMTREEAQDLYETENFKENPTREQREKNVKTR